VIEPDPIFAAIEAYRATDQAWFARALFEDALAGKGIKLAPPPPTIAARRNWCACSMHR
jgi:hypothetical protein